MLAARPTRPRLILHYPPPVMLRLLRSAGPRPGRSSPSARPAPTAPEPGSLGAGRKRKPPAFAALEPDRQTLAARSRRSKSVIPNGRRRLSILRRPLTDGGRSRRRPRRREPLPRFRPTGTGARTPG
jgi:hypothetical protein